MSLEITLSDEKRTEAFASELARVLRAPLCIALNGPLGAGKTTFVRYLVSALGIQDAVSSPTYVLQHEYGNSSKIEHWDLYRLQGPPEELFEPPMANTIRIIEWAEKFPDLTCDLTLTFGYTSAEQENSRSVKLMSNDTGLLDRLKLASKL